MPMRLSAACSLLQALAIVLLAGCATVATDVTVFDQTRKFAPTEHVAILLDYPGEPHVKLALIEARGAPGGSEAELFAATRQRARALGANAVVRLEVDTVYQPPVRVYDPAYANSLHRHRYRSFYYQPFANALYPFDSYQWVGGGTVQTLKAVAIRYTPESR